MRPANSRLPVPGTGPEQAATWVARHLGDAVGDAAPPSARFRGGQQAADAALAGYTVGGYAGRRNEVWPPQRRGASGLSPYIRHGLLSLPRVWARVQGGPQRDVDKFRDELLWQEYSRHLYARLGERTARALRFDPPRNSDAWPRAEPWPDDMACIAVSREELHRDGWLVNQARMWLASQWSVRAGAPWRAGEDEFFRHLLDGSRAANRLGWQWSVGTAIGKPYSFMRWQVEKRAPGLCRSCALDASCPIERRPSLSDPKPLEGRPSALGEVAADATGAGPEAARLRDEAEFVWLTAESLAEAEPALDAHRDLPALFVFDAPRLERWKLSARRLVFLVETLAELATRRNVEVWRGEPGEVLEGRRLAVTYTPVPGWRALEHRLEINALHPWPWLRRPHAGSIQSFSQWRRGLLDPPERPEDFRPG